MKLERDVWAGWEVMSVWMAVSVIFVAIDPDDSLWRSRLQKLEQYEAISKHPSTLEETLARYQHIHDDLTLLEKGFKLRNAVTGAETQCITVLPLYPGYNRKEY